MGTKFLVYWWNYKHKTTVYPIYLELKRRGLNVRALDLHEASNEEVYKQEGHFMWADCIVTSSNHYLPYKLGCANKIVWTWHGAVNAILETFQGELSET